VTKKLLAQILAKRVSLIDGLVRKNPDAPLWPDWLSLMRKRSSMPCVLVIRQALSDGDKRMARWLACKNSLA